MDNTKLWINNEKLSTTVNTRWDQVSICHQKLDPLIFNDSVPALIQYDYIYIILSIFPFVIEMRRRHAPGSRRESKFKLFFFSNYFQLYSRRGVDTVKWQTFDYKRINKVMLLLFKSLLGGVRVARLLKF